MKKIQKFFSILLVLGSFASSVSLNSCTTSTSSENPAESSTAQTSQNDGSATKAEVSSIKMKTLPTKTEYYVNDTFSVEGGVLSVTYADNTTGDVPLTADGVEYKAPDMSKEGKKTITIKYGGKSTRFSVQVSEHALNFYFDLNYEGSDPIVKEVVAGFKVKSSDAGTPTRAGYTFYKWYIDKNCTIEYDFDTIIQQDGERIYAKWKENGATYYDVKFDLNYIGAKQREYPQIVKSGEYAYTPAITPTYDQHTFKEWTTDSAGTISYQATTFAISQDTSIYAQWTKSTPVKTNYVFEAENVNLNGKSGPGYSGSNSNKNMIVSDAGGSRGASEGRFVCYQGMQGCSLEFEIVTDVACTANLVFRFAAESKSMILTTDNKNTGSYAKYKISYGTSLNDLTEIKYSDIELNTMPDSENGAFKDCAIGNINLKVGANVVQVMTDNTNTDGLGGTYKATAPAIDCMKLNDVTNEAAVIWNGEKGCPFANQR